MKIVKTSLCLLLLWIGLFSTARANSSRPMHPVEPTATSTPIEPSSKPRFFGKKRLGKKARASAPMPKTQGDPRLARKQRAAGGWSIALGLVNGVQAFQGLITFFLLLSLGTSTPLFLIGMAALAIYTVYAVLEIRYGVLIRRESAQNLAGNPLTPDTVIKRARVGISIGAIRLGVAAIFAFIALTSAPFFGLQWFVVIVFSAIPSIIALAYLIPNARLRRHLRAIQDGLPPTPPAPNR